MTRFFLTSSHFMFFLLFAARCSLPLVGVAQAQPLTPAQHQDLEDSRQQRAKQSRDKRDAENSEIMRKMYVQEVVKLPLKVNPVAGTVVDIFEEMGWYSAKRKFFDLPHFNEATNQIQDIYADSVNNALSDHKDYEIELEEIHTQLARARNDLDTINKLERKQRRLRRLIGVMDGVIDTFERRLKYIDEVKHKYNAGGDVPTVLDNLLDDLNNDIKGNVGGDNRTAVEEAKEEEQADPAVPNSRPRKSGSRKK